MPEHPLFVAADMTGHVLAHQALDLVIGIQPPNLLLQKDDPFFKGTHKIASVNLLCLQYGSRCRKKMCALLLNSAVAGTKNNGQLNRRKGLTQVRQ
jgi:hypothetical protein